MHHHEVSLAPFEPPWWLRSAHAQTLAAAYWPQRLPEHRAIARQVELADGDVVVVHDDTPDNWSAGGRIALLAHGLGGCHRSPLLVRLAAKLNACGVRVFRWDMRGCGAGVGLARRPYHAGCSQDLKRVIESVLTWCSFPSRDPKQNNRLDTSRVRLTLFGVSLSGNIVLKFLGESPESVPSQVYQAIAVNPPIDLAASVKTLQGRINRMYDRHFVGALSRHLAEWQKLRPGSPMPLKPREPRSLYEFDDWYTAPMSGYLNAETYYARCSAAQFIPNINVPTTIITSRDDPLVPFSMFDTGRVPYPASVRIAATDHGGHVGYISRRGLDADPHWLDWRVVELITAEDPQFHR